VKTYFANAGWNEFRQERDHYTGLMGLGGSAMQWHRGAQVGFGYAMNLIELTPTNERAKSLQHVALACAHQQEAVRVLGSIARSVERNPGQYLQARREAESELGRKLAASEKGLLSEQISNVPVKG